jgi:GDP-4-dehydro-6-deoxy-D-mannose reductase
MSDKKWLITGIAGFCGSALAELLIARGCDVIGIDVAPIDAATVRRLGATCEWIRVDLADAEAVRHAVMEVKPDYAVHLAALTNPAAPLAALVEANVYGTVHLLDAIKSSAPGCTVLIAGSSAQYGLTHPDENPITETQIFRPITPYAVTKATQDMVGGLYSAVGLRIVRARTFNIVGPRQKAGFVSASFAKQIAEIELGLRAPAIEVGNLEARRDFVDVRDVVHAYWLAATQGRPGAIYNVCSGEAHSVRELLDGLLALSRNHGIEVRQVAYRLQAADVPAQVGSYRQLAVDTGWRPEIGWEQMLRDLLDYWRGVVEREG